MVEWGVVDICVRAADSGNAKHKFISPNKMTFTSHKGARALYLSHNKNVPLFWICSILFLVPFFLNVFATHKHTHKSV